MYTNGQIYQATRIYDFLTFQSVFDFHIKNNMYSNTLIILPAHFLHNTIPILMEAQWGSEIYVKILICWYHDFIDLLSKWNEYKLNFFIGCCHARLPLILLFCLHIFVSFFFHWMKGVEGHNEPICNVKEIDLQLLQLKQCNIKVTICFLPSVTSFLLMASPLLDLNWSQKSNLGK